MVRRRTTPSSAQSEVILQKDMNASNWESVAENEANADENDSGKQMAPLVGEAPKTNMGRLEIESPNVLGENPFGIKFDSNPEFYNTAIKFTMAFCGLQISYLTWGYMQELIMTTVFLPTELCPDGKFPSPTFCVFSNRFLAVLVAMVAVKMRHGSVFGNNTAPLLAFTPCAMSNTVSSWSQYASLKFVSFPVQTVFKSSKVIPVMIMGKFLSGTKYPLMQYFEAFLITVGVAVFSLASKVSDKESTTDTKGFLLLLLYITFDSFTSQWQNKVYSKYGKQNIDPYQMMLGVNCSAIVITSLTLIYSGELPKVYEFFQTNPAVLQYNIITAITSASGQLCIYYTIKEFGPIVFTIIMTTRQMLSITISSILFGHTMSPASLFGAAIVFGVIFFQIRKKYIAKSSPRV